MGIKVGKIAIFVLSLNVLFISGCSQDQTFTKPEKYYKKNYTFTSDMFTDAIAIWEEALASFKGKANINYLEIGVYEGRSVIWMLENILTHETAKMTCIDIFEGEYYQTFLSNLKMSGHRDKVTVVKGFSQIQLRNLPLQAFDIIYIDGSHSAPDVLADTVFSWYLLKNRGILIFDDYLLDLDLSVTERPKFAIDAFMTCFAKDIEIVKKEYQIVLRKL